MSKPIDEILAQLTEIQRHFEAYICDNPSATVVSEFQQFANTLRTTRMILQVFADEWTGTIHTPKHPGTSPDNQRCIPSESEDDTPTAIDDNGDVDH